MNKYGFIGLPITEHIITFVLPFSSGSDGYSFWSSESGSLISYIIERHDYNIKEFDIPPDLLRKFHFLGDVNIHVVFDDYLDDGVDFFYVVNARKFPDSKFDACLRLTRRKFPGIARDIVKGLIEIFDDMYKLWIKDEIYCDGLRFTNDLDGVWNTMKFLCERNGYGDVVRSAYWEMKRIGHGITECRGDFYSLNGYKTFMGNMLNIKKLHEIVDSNEYRRILEYARERGVIDKSVRKNTRKKIIDALNDLNDDFLMEVGRAMTVYYNDSEYDSDGVMELIRRNFRTRGCFDEWTRENEDWTEDRENEMENDEK